MLAQILALTLAMATPLQHVHSSAYITNINVDLNKQMLYTVWSDHRKTKPIFVSTGYSRHGLKCITGNEHNCTEHYHGHVRPLGGKYYYDTAGYLMSYYVEFDGTRGEGIHSGQDVIKGSTASHGCVRVLGDDNMKTIRYNVNSKTILDIYGIPPN